MSMGLPVGGCGDDAVQQLYSSWESDNLCVVTVHDKGTKHDESCCFFGTHGVLF